MINKKTTNIYVIYNPNDNRKQVKVGQTDDWTKREKQYKTSGFEPKVLHLEYDCNFTDDDIKKILIEDLKYTINKNNGDEWYILKDNENEENFTKNVKAIIASLKNNKPLDLLRTECFAMREEQRDCVEKTYNAFEVKKYDKFLWNCKMRFGKTFTAYQLIKKAQYKNSLILTWKVAVESSWKEDLLNHVDFENYNFIEKNTLDRFDKNKNNVVFLSIPLLLANKKIDDVEKELEKEISNNGKEKEISDKDILIFKDKLKNIANINWDLLIIDEAHYGIRAKNTEKIIKLLNYKRKLELSGTPFKIIADSEYLNCQRYDWTYTDEQKKKKEYSYLGDKNPYKDLPDMNIYTYDGINELINDNGNYDFNLNDLFNIKNNDFLKIDIVKSVIDFMCGRKFDLVEERDIKESNVILPYFADMIEKNKKSLWFLPNVASVCAMEKLLKNHIFFKDYYIINATGNGEGSSINALKKFKEVEKIKDKIICLSCGMLNTGVTIKTLNSVIILQNKGSAQDFFQSIFRCQSPCKDKSDCFVFDFNPKKYFNNVLDFIKTNNNSRKKNDKNDKNDKIDDKELIEELLIKTSLYIDGKMINTDYNEMMNYVTLDQNPEKIKKSFLKSNNINLNLLESQNNDILEIIDKIPLYRNERKETKKDILKSSKTNKKDRVRKEQDPTIPKRKENSKYDIRKAKLDVLISSLTIFIYITNAEEKTLMEIIETDEGTLFNKICFIGIGEFYKLYKNEFFKNEILNKAIYKFWREEYVSRDWNDIIEESIIGNNI